MHHGPVGRAQAEIALTAAAPAQAPGGDPVRRAVLLVVIAGFVDAVGFLALAGTFVAFMSGNTSAGGAFTGGLDVGRALRQLFPLPVFVAGIYAGALVVQAASPAARHRRYASVLGVEFALIAFVLAGALASGVRAAVPLEPAARFYGLAAPLAVAMGLQNAMRMEVKGVGLATTYVTGTLHVAAQALARATVLARREGRSGSGVVPVRSEARRAARDGVTALGVWLGFLVGAVAGGALFTWVGVTSLVVPLFLLLTLAVDFARPPRP